MTEQVWWYATRAAGLMTWSTAVASVLLGLLLSTRLLGNKPSGPWLLDVHRFLGGLSAVFLLIHMGSLWADSYVAFGPAELLVPGRSSWNPSAGALGVSAVTWGIGAAYALIAVELTSILRKHMRPDLWRAVHYLSIITVVAGSVHAYQAGTDVDNPLVMGTAVGSSVLVVLLSVLRIRGAPARESPDDRVQMLTEMRRRLDSLPVPEATAQPSLAQAENSVLPRRAPVRAEGIDLDPTSMNDQASFAPESGTEPELAAPVGENTLLAGLAESGAPSVDPELFAGLQGDDAEFDPGGWSSELSPMADKMFPQRPAGELSPTSDPTPSHDEPPFDEPSHDEPPFDEPSTEVEPEVDPRSLLSELQTPASPPPIVEPIFHRPPTPEPPLAPPPQESETADPEPIPPPAPEPVVADRAQVDVWETALESLLGEGLPRLPSFDPPEIPPIEALAAFEVPEAHPVERPAPRPPLVEPIIPPPAPQPLAPPPPAPAPAAPLPTASPPPAPPPLPVDAIDPDTGEADESAYRDWLVEWLAYAERYGDEAPADPTRVDS